MTKGGHEDGNITKEETGNKKVSCNFLPKFFFQLFLHFTQLEVHTKDRRKVEHIKGGGGIVVRAKNLQRNYFCREFALNLFVTIC